MTPYEKIEDLASENAYSDDVKHLREVLGDIYSIAHVMVDRCENKHKDWVREFGLIDGIVYETMCECTKYDICTKCKEVGLMDNVK